MKFNIAFVGLILLAGINLLLSYAHGLAGFYVWISLAIAALQIGIVLVVFMELGEARATSWYAILTGFAFVVLLVGMIVAEELTRVPPPLSPTGSVF